MKVTICQLDNRRGYLEPMLEALAAHVKEEGTDFFVVARDVLFGVVGG